MFSAISSKKWGRTFRYAAVFKDHVVDESLLRQAAADLQKRFPLHYAYLRRGFFWNYLVQTEELPEIRPEDGRPVHPIVLHKDEKPDFRIVYTDRRLALEGAHYISDGYGQQSFFLSLLQRYMILAGLTEEKPQENILYWKDAAAVGEQEDAFLKYGNNDSEKAKEEHKDVHHFEPLYEKDALYLTYFLMHADAVKDRAVALGVTLTEYITAVYMLSIIKAEKEPIRKPLCIDIPVNLRRFFETKTLRNFVFQVSTVLQTDGRQDWTLEEIAHCIKGQVAAQLTVDRLSSILKKLTSLAKNPVVRLVPNVIKRPVLTVLQKRSHANQTGIYTNLGVVELPQTMTQHIERLELVNGDTKGYGLPSTCSSVSFNNQFVFCVSANNLQQQVWQEFAKILSAQGLGMRVECSYAQKKEAALQTANGGRCVHCGVSLPGDYAACPLCGCPSSEEEKTDFQTVAVPYPSAEVRAKESAVRKSASCCTAQRLQAYFHF